MSRARLVIIGFILSPVCYVQAQKGSTLLNPVVVYGLPEEKYLTGSRFTRTDSLLYTDYQSAHLGDLLANQLPAYFRNYGGGMLSGISLRGTSTQHTAVLWNGININSFSLGQADFSILPSFVFDDVAIHEGGGSARFGSGAIGGTVILETGSETVNIAHVQLEAGSFGRFFSGARINLQQRAFTSSTSVYRLQSQNDFPVHSTGERQNHASFFQQGFVQNFSYNFSNAKVLKLTYWYHDADREIQPTIGNALAGDEQQDRNHRLSFTYQQNNRFGLLKSGGGLINDEIIYNGSSSQVFRWETFINHQYRFGRNWSVQGSADWNHIIGKIREYGTEPVEDRVDLLLAIQKEFSRAGFVVNIRKPFITGISTPFVLYTGGEFTLLKSTGNSLRYSFNVSTNFRAPTLNDRYWPEVGNKDLLPERTKSAESGLTWSNASVNVSATGFYQLVDQWIQWTPDEDGVYRPENILKVAARGIELSGLWHWKTGEFRQKFRGTYQYTRSTVKEANDAARVGKQLTYTPIHTGTVSSNSMYKSWSIDIFCQYAGERFTDTSNASLYALDPYFLADFFVTKKFILNRHNFSVQASVKNLFDVEYQQLASRAMPGRNYNFSLQYQLKNK